MNTPINKAVILASALGLAAIAPTAAQAEQVSLEKYLQYVVTQQSKAVFESVTQEVAYSIEQEVANFNIDSLLRNEKGVPSVTIHEATAQLDNLNKPLSEESAK
ncbi:hypothetical protein QWY77_13580 [Thalassotalea ponticola]|uniref:hypothetical protein n=1 Tax=Thalassotalea ponticola TaxID=1523392 RepID=UPI0025B625C3|nr:hypothetical protein [Thalassotalea ponticola]MDN3653771.1 hypothetical protein [Thalassotalea ponticola]